jgi:hypothetical protein
MSADPFFEDLPLLDPIIVHESTDYGWRGLTENGEVIEVKSRNHHKAAVPDGELVMVRQGIVIGRRAIEQRGFSIDEYLTVFNRAAALFRRNEIDAALREANVLMRIAPTLYARFNRSFMLLAVGRWAEGLAEMEHCERHPPFLRPHTRDALAVGLKPWRGEDIAGKRLLLVHDHGFGDTVMCLRYIPQLKAMGIDVVMLVPGELETIAWQFGSTIGPVVDEAVDADYFTPFLHLLRWLNVMPENVPSEPYLKVNERLVQHWRKRIGVSERKRIGIAWSVGQVYKDDYPRAIALEQFIEALDPEAELFSVQAQAPEAPDVHAYEFEDFADCAALMSLMDEIVSVDTAALHLAGAIGHPCVYGLLSHWHSWRWQASWYRNVKLCRQTSAGDWGSALAQLGA